MKLTDEQKIFYMESNGIYCPHCDSNDLESSTIDLDCDMATVYVQCLDCKSDWYDEYKFVGISNFRLGAER